MSSARQGWLAPAAGAAALAVCAAVAAAAYRRGASPPGAAEQRVELARPDGVAVGHEQFIEVAGRRYQRRTLALDPLVFVVDDFLDPSEVRHLLELGERKGYSPDAGFRANSEDEELHVQDLNDDGVLELQEVRLMLEDNFRALLPPEVVADFIAASGLDGDGDGRVTHAELSAWAEARGDSWLGQLRAAVQEVVAADSARSMRTSDQVWLQTHTDTVLHGVSERAARLAGLPDELHVPGATDLLIVRYAEGGHYHAHYDSRGRDGPEDQPCCHVARQLAPRGQDIDRSQCRSCRWATVLLYLADTEEGGETTFPVTAAGYDKSSFSYLKWRSDWNRSRAEHYCSGGSGAVRVTPRLGRAAIFYSHLDTVRPDGLRWMGPNDPFSLHAACNVARGRKRTGNLWLWVDPFPQHVPRKGGG